MKTRFVVGGVEVVDEKTGKWRGAKECERDKIVAEGRREAKLQCARILADIEKLKKI